MNQPFSQRTPQYYLERLEPEILASFSEQQLATVHSLLDAAISKPSPKIIDLRLTVDLIVSRFYVVVFVGKDRRRTNRAYPVTRATRIANMATAMALLIGLNLAISAFIFLTAYLVKSAMNINLFPESLQELVEGKAGQK
ncbi:MAG TPA: hypothetical protein V6C88_03640 [Chroococcidiopsis sp.]